MQKQILLKKKVIIFGAGGQLGADLMNDFKDLFLVKGLSHLDADITKKDFLEKLFLKEQPNVVINAAAYNRVEEAEFFPEEAFKVNALGPFFLSQAAAKTKAVFIQISTDYVFDGKKGSYSEKDQPNPINVYGASKLAGEQLAKIGCPALYVIRTSALFGKAKSRQKINFIDKMMSLAAGRKEIRVVDDQYTSPTYTADLSKKIKEIIIKKAPFGVYHLTNSGRCSWHEFAKEIFRQKGVVANLTAISTAESGTKIKRPKSTILKNDAIKKINIKAMPSWQDALARYLKSKIKI